MYKGSLFLIIVAMSAAIGMISIGAKNGDTTPPMYVWVGCDGNAVTRTEVGKIVMTRIAKNTTNCNGPKSTSVSGSNEIIDTGAISETTSQSLDMFEDEVIENTPKKSDKILLDLSQKDIVNYRVELIKQEQIRYANAIRSVRIRQGKSLESNTK